jgi:hypothetical protein
MGNATVLGAKNAMKLRTIGDVSRAAIGWPQPRYRSLTRNRAIRDAGDMQPAHRRRRDRDVELCSHQRDHRGDLRSHLNDHGIEPSLPACANNGVVAIACSNHTYGVRLRQPSALGAECEVSCGDLTCRPRRRQPPSSVADSWSSQRNWWLLSPLAARRAGQIVPGEKAFDLCLHKDP